MPKELNMVNTIFFSKEKEVKKQFLNLLKNYVNLTPLGFTLCTGGRQSLETGEANKQKIVTQSLNHYFADSGSTFISV